MAETNMMQLALFRKHLESSSPDLLRQMIQDFAESVMCSEASARCGADLGSREATRVNQRNGYRQRRWDTRAGSIDLSIPKLRQGSYFPDWLLNPRRRAEKALTQVVAECYSRGVSTRRVDGLVKALGIDGMDKSQVSELSQQLDQTVSEFRQRQLQHGPYSYVWCTLWFTSAARAVELPM